MTKINPIEYSKMNQIEKVDTGNLTKSSDVSIISKDIVDKEINPNQKGEELSKQFIKAIKSNDKAQITNLINELISLNNSDVMTYLSYHYGRITDENNGDKKIGQSFAYTISNLPMMKENPEILSTLKGICKEGSSGYNDFLAADLFKALNSNDENKTNMLINNINPSNVRNVAYYYNLVASQTEEIAATKSEEKFIAKDDSFLEYLKSIFTISTSADVKTHARRKETLIQGILNQEGIPYNKRAQNFRQVINQYLAQAESLNLDQNKIQNIRESTDIIEKATRKSSQNAYHIENTLQELFKGVQ